MMPHTPTTKQQLCDNIQSGYAQIEELFSEIRPDSYKIPGAVGEWSVHDLLAHLLFWQQTIIDDINTVRQGENQKPRGNVDQLNHRAVLDARRRSWNDLYADFRQSTQALIETVNSLSEDDLFNSSKYAAIEDRPLWEAVANESYEHYEEHIAQIRSWWERSLPEGLRKKKRP